MTDRADLLVADIGSTLTKLSAFGGLNSPSPRLLGQGLGLTSVGTGDVSIGLDEARNDLEQRFTIDTSSAGLMAASSAAGGLKMSVHGLTLDMTLRAAREASLGAGALISLATASHLRDSDVEQINALRPDIIMLAGGIDYGDREVVLANSAMLARLEHLAPIIYAGNCQAQEEVRAILNAAGKEVICVDNVYPRLDELNVTPVRKVIQDVFSEHIITAPRMERVKAAISGDVIPTPGAVMRSTELLYELLGDLVVVDIGGATSDVHSVSDGSPKFVAKMLSPEPRAKRTVEGDLGVYINADNVIRATEGVLDAMPIEALPQSSSDQENSALLARWAVDIALWRHAGELKVAYGAYGRSEVVEGKDLTAVNHVIGTGGALTRLGRGADILSSVRQDPRGHKLLPAADTPVLIDHDYVMATAGVLSQVDQESAQQILADSIGLSSAQSQRRPSDG